MPRAAKPLLALQHDFGPERFGTVYESFRDTRSVLFPARDVLRLPLHADLQITAGALAAANPGAALPRSIGVLSFGPQLTPGQLVAVLANRRVTIASIDLSHLPPCDPADLAGVSLPGPRTWTRSWTPPAWLAPEGVQWLGERLGARRVVAAPAFVTPTWTGDSHALEALVQRARSAHPDITAPADLDAAVNLAEMYLDSRRFDESLAVLAPGLAGERGAAFLAAAPACLELGDLPAALAAFAAAEASGEVALGSARAHRADALRRTGHKNEALLVIDDALAEAPDSGFALVVKGFALLEVGQVQGAARVHARLTELMPGARDELVLAALIEAARAKVGTTGSSSRVGRKPARRVAAAWERVVAEYPNDADALRNLARAQRISRPWSSGWAGTQLSAVDEAGPRSGSGRTLAALAVKHPRETAGPVAATAGGTWLGLALVGVAPPVALGYPLLAGTAAGALAFAFLRRQIPARARRAAHRMGRSAKRAWIGFAVLGLAAVVSIAVGRPVVHPSLRCVSGHSDCADELPPTLPRFTFVPPTIRPRTSLPGFTIPSRPFPPSTGPRLTTPPRTATPRR